MRDDYQKPTTPQPPPPPPSSQGQRQRQDSSLSTFSSQGGGQQQQQGLRRRKEQQGSMGEGFYISVDESNGNESPKKRARTGSLSDHGIPTHTQTYRVGVLFVVEMETDKMVQSP